MSTVELYAESIGQGDALVILHGLFGSARNWQTFSRALADDYQVISIDLRNHGQSPHADTMTYSEMSTDVIELLDRYQIERAIVLGHSMGGKTAMQMAFDHPERIQQLIVVDIAPVPYAHDYDDLLRALSSLPLDQVNRRSDANEFLKLNVTDNELRLFLLQNLVFKKAQQPYWRINIPALKTGISHLLRYEFPTSAMFNGQSDFIRGELSDYVVADYYPEIKRYFPTASIHSIADAGHWPHAQNPAAFLSQVQQLLA